ncbi:MAG TPA: PadR family transcriptional regulator [Bacteroidales bacterium]|nr:PadR family transcriptional regulator [Bacteroidales bacterium]
MKNSDTNKEMISKELFKGSLKSIVLKLLTENSKMYGYEITQKVQEMTGGRIKLTFGALYPILHKLETDGSVITESEIINGRVRIYYKLTKTGKNVAKEKIKELQEFIEMINILLKPGLNLELCKI